MYIHVYISTYIHVTMVGKRHRRTCWPELQRDNADWAASTGPALQVEAGVAGVNVSEDGLILVELGLCETNGITSGLSCIYISDTVDIYGGSELFQLLI